MSNLKVKKAKLDTLVSDTSNPRKHNDKNIRAIRTSLEQFGQVLPIVVKDGVVVGGNGTLQAMQELGWTDCQVVELDASLTDAQIRQLKVALNRTAELAGWDYEVLTPIFAEMKDAGMDLADFGWDDFEVEPLLVSEWAAPTGAADAPLGGERSAAKDHDGESPVEGANEAGPTQRALVVAREHLGKKASDRECLDHICTEWLSAQEP